MLVNGICSSVKITCRGISTKLSIYMTGRHNVNKINN